jgi:hypothetical protein
MLECALLYLIANTGQNPSQLTQVTSYGQYLKGKPNVVKEHGMIFTCLPNGFKLKTFGVPNKRPNH